MTYLESFTNTWKTLLLVPGVNHFPNASLYWIKNLYPIQISFYFKSLLNILKNKKGNIIFKIEMKYIPAFYFVIGF